MKFVHDGAELGREHNLTHLHPSKGFRFKCVSLIFKCVILSSSTELVSNIKFMSQVCNIVKFYRVGLKHHVYESSV